MDPQDPPTSNEQPIEPRTRKPYEKPLLQVYGELSEIAQGLAKGKLQDGSGHPNKHFTS
jgi:hypothetical protein